MSTKDRVVTATSTAFEPIRDALPAIDVAGAVEGMRANAASMAEAARAGVSNSFIGSAIRGEEPSERLDSKAGAKGRQQHEARGEDSGSTYDDRQGLGTWFTEVESFEDPEIQHDQGFLEGWDDRNNNQIRDEEDYEDTRTHQVDESLRQDPTWSDRLSQLKWLGMLEGAEALRPDLVDATAAYRHFLFGNGAAYTFSYDRFLQNDSSGRVVEQAGIDDAELAALFEHDMHREFGAPAMPAAAAPAAGATGGDPPGTAAAEDATQADTTPFTVMLQSDVVNIGGGAYPYPGTENWQKAIGGHSMWMQTNATVTPRPEAGERDISMDVTFKMQDMYNFNPGMADMATGITDEQNGRLAVVGIGNQFLQSAEASRHVESTQPLESADRELVGTNAVEGGPNRAQQRRPDNSRGHPGAR